MNWVVKAIGTQLKQLGKEMILETPEGDQTVLAILDPVSSTDQMARTKIGLADGCYPPGSYQYIGPPNIDVSSARVLRDGEKRYEFRRTECYQYGQTPIYWWGLLIECGDENG